MKMKSILFISVILLLLTQHLFSQNVGINSTGAAPNNSAMLDIVSNNMGLLVPRLALSATNNATPVTGPATSLLVYNTATAGVAPNNVTPGYYFWDGSQWVRFVTGSISDDWALLGNAGTNPATNFIGTTDNQNFIIRTNGIERMRVEAGGDIGVGNTSPEAKFHSHQSGIASGDIAIMATQNMNLSTSITAALFVAGGTDYDIYQYSGGRNALWAPTAIGHNDPTQMLDVDGNARLRAHIYDSNNSAGFDDYVLSRDAGGVIWVDPSTLDDEDWALLGNAGTNSSTNFLGTTDAQALVFRTNNTERIRIQTDGTVSIGTTLDNASNIYNRVENTNSTNYYALFNYHYGSYTGTTYALYNNNSSSTNSTKNGIYNYTSSTGTGGRFGISNNMYQNSASTSTAYGIYNYASTYGNTAYGMRNYLYYRGTTTGYGLENYSSSTGSGTFYGIRNYIEGTGTGTQYGEYISMNNTGSGTKYGSFYNMTTSTTGTKYGIYMDLTTSGSTTDYAMWTTGGNVHLNSSSGNYDFQVRSQTRTHALFVDADNDVVRCGLESGSLSGNGTTPTGTSGVVDYVADFDKGGSYGTAIGVGSVEYLFDQSSETMISNRFSPTSDGSYTLGKSTHRWNALYATNGTIQTSDEKQKKNIITLNYGLKEVLLIRPISFEWREKKQENVVGDVHLGFSAQDLLQIVPEVVQTHEMICISEVPLIYEKREVANLGVYYAEIIPILVRALQEEDTKVENLKTKIVEQEQVIQDLKQQNIEIIKRLEELENK